MSTYTAVLDRFEVDADDRRLAVLLLEADGEQGGDLVVPAEELPEAACHQDAVLEVEVDDGDLVSATYRPEETEQRRERAQSRFDQLSRRLGKEGNEGRGKDGGSETDDEGEVDDVDGAGDADA